MSALARLVEASDDPLVKRQWESLVEASRAISGVTPSHVINEEYPEPTWTTSGDDLDSLLWHVDAIRTLVDDHEFVPVKEGSLFCSVCYGIGEAQHRNADEMTTNGLL